MDSDPMLFLMFLLLLYILFRDLQPRTPLHAPVAPLGGAPRSEGRGPVPSNLDPSPMRIEDEGVARMPIRDSDRAFLDRNAAGPNVGSSRFETNDHLERPNVIGGSASQSNVLAVNSTQVNPVPSESTVSVSTLGSSFVKNFAGLKVNTTYSFLASRSAPPGDQTPPSSPLSSPPPSPFLSSLSSFQTPIASRVRSGTPFNAVDFSLYKKKTRIVTKSPKKTTNSSGKLPAAAHEPADDITTTTSWFYNTSAASRLQDTPPDLTGHPEGLALGDIYFDSVEDQYRLWLWCLDDIGIPHWKHIPFGYEREDGKRLIVTRKVHFLSWVTTKYYKELINEEERSAAMDIDED